VNVEVKQCEDFTYSVLGCW